MKNIKHYILLIIIASSLLLPGITSIPLIDRDEAHFVQATKQMLETGNYFQVRFLEKTRFQKPPGINWLQAASVKIFSGIETTKVWPFRIPSVLGAFFAILLTYFYTSRIINPKVAFVAGILLSCSLLLIVEAHMGVIDASLLLSVVLMQGALWALYVRDNLPSVKSIILIAVFWFFCAFGFLLKGVTPLVAILTLCTIAVIDKSISIFKKIKFFWGLLFFLIVTLTWLYLVNTAENSNYLLKMLQKDLLPKLKGGHESHGQPPLFHLIILPITFWPSSIFLYSGIKYGWLNRAVKNVKFLLAWIVPTWLFFELMPTKLPQYVLPTFPALAILCALAIDNINYQEIPTKLLRVLQILWGVLSLGFLLFLMFVIYYFKVNMDVWGYFVWGSALSLAFLVTILAFTGRYKQTLIAVFLLAWPTFYLMFGVVLPNAKPLWLPSSIHGYVKKLNVPNPILAVVGYNEPSMVFYFGTQNIKYVGLTQGQKMLDENKTKFLLIDVKNYKNISDKRNYKLLKSYQGYNYSKGKWVCLKLLRRKNETF